MPAPLAHILKFSLNTIKGEVGEEQETAYDGFRRGQTHVENY